MEFVKRRCLALICFTVFTLFCCDFCSDFFVLPVFQPLLLPQAFLCFLAVFLRQNFRVAKEHMFVQIDEFARPLVNRVVSSSRHIAVQSFSLFQMTPSLQLLNSIQIVLQERTIQHVNVFGTIAVVADSSGGCCTTCVVSALLRLMP